MPDESPGPARHKRQQLESAQLIDAVRVREQFLEDILGSLESFVTVDRDWRFTFVNEAAAKLAGRRPDELIGKNLLELIPPTAVAQASGPLREAMSERVSVEFEVDSRAREEVFHAKAYPLSDGGLAIYVRNVTDRRRIEQALRDNEELLRTILDHSRDGINMLDLKSGEYVFMNPAQVLLTGFTTEELNGISAEEALERVHPGDLEISKEQQRQVAAGEDVDEPVEYRWRVKSGEYRWFSDRGKIVRGKDGEPVALVGISRDITGRKQTERALRESEAEKAAQRERTHLARELHDSVTQALFAATMKAEALTLDDALPARSVGTAVEVMRLTRGALAQMRALLLELRADPLEETPVQQLLRHLVEATESRVRTAVRLTVDEEEPLPGALHSPVYRIVQEALNNVARHAVASHAWVSLDVRPSEFDLVVGDDGVGFDPDAVDPSHHGLRSMRERAEEVGARLQVQTSIGGGTHVTVDWRDGSGA